MPAGGFPDVKRLADLAWPGRCEYVGIRRVRVPPPLSNPPHLLPVRILVLGIHRHGYSKHGRANGSVDDTSTDGVIPQVGQLGSARSKPSWAGHAYEAAVPTRQWAACSRVPIWRCAHGAKPRAPALWIRRGRAHREASSVRAGIVRSNLTPTWRADSSRTKHQRSVHAAFANVRYAWWA
jgi:hypothetical protein